MIYKPVSCSQLWAKKKLVLNLNNFSSLCKLRRTAWQCPLWLPWQMLVAHLPISCQILYVWLPVADTDSYKDVTHADTQTQIKICVDANINSPSLSHTHVHPERDDCSHSRLLKPVHMRRRSSVRRLQDLHPGCMEKETCSDRPCTGITFRRAQLKHGSDVISLKWLPSPESDRHARSKTCEKKENDKSEKEAMSHRRR